MNTVFKRLEFVFCIIAILCLVGGIVGNCLEKERSTTSIELFSIAFVLAVGALLLDFVIFRNHGQPNDRNGGNP
ncbi:MAG: hypothetical protein V1685_00435 [Parcubacteria group bacterium]